MKARIRTALVIAGIAIAMVAASQSISPDVDDLIIKKRYGMPRYSEKEVHDIMRINHWGRQKAIEVLVLSCQSDDKNIK